MKRQAKNSDDPLYRYLHEMTDEQLVAALHELADRIEGQALVASKKSMPTNGLPRGSSLRLRRTRTKTVSSSEGEGDGEVARDSFTRSNLPYRSRTSHRSYCCQTRWLCRSVSQRQPCPDCRRKDRRLRADDAR